jgi:hypothetical protein
MKKQHSPSLEKHTSHQVEIRPGKAHHAAQYYCVECNKWVAWISQTDLDILKKEGIYNV